MRASTALLLMLLTWHPAMASPWGEDYFPNYLLTDQDGNTHRFFDDLIRDRIVAINFIYTTCPDTCPVETAQLVKVSRILGDRLGNDVFIYSITIDPQVDTPEVLKEYREKFRANWTFLTGDEQEIISLRRKLGLYIEEIQDGSNNHNVSMIIGNQKTGRWMKRSPFENPHVLADQLGNWLDGWRSPQKGQDYASAPRLRNISQGEQLYRTRCVSCHSLTGTTESDALGPDLLGVTDRRSAAWLSRWLREPDRMLADGDPIAVELLAAWNNVAMPNQRLNQLEVMDLLGYISRESTRLAMLREDPDKSVAVLDAWVKEALPGASVNAGYLTVLNASDEPLELNRIESTDFETIEVHSMASGRMQRIENLAIPPSGGRASLSPGGKHLMLMGAKRALLPGDSVHITLHFSNGLSSSVPFEVRSQTDVHGY